MGKMLIFAAIVLFVVLVLGAWGLFLENRKTANTMGLKGSKKRLAALETAEKRHVDALKEIRDIATTSELIDGNAMFSLIVDKADRALQDQTDTTNEKDTE
jgi:hypothetical protein